MEFEEILDGIASTVAWLEFDTREAMSNQDAEVLENLRLRATKLRRAVTTADFGLTQLAADITNHQLTGDANTVLKGQNDY